MFRRIGIRDGDAFVQIRHDEHGPLPRQRFSGNRGTRLQGELLRQLGYDALCHMLIGGEGDDCSERIMFGLGEQFPRDERRIG